MAEKREREERTRERDSAAAVADVYASDDASAKNKDGNSKAHRCNCAGIPFAPESTKHNLPLIIRMLLLLAHSAPAGSHI